MKTPIIYSSLITIFLQVSDAKGHKPSWQRAWAAIYIYKGGYVFTGIYQFSC